MKIATQTAGLIIATLGILLIIAMVFGFSPPPEKETRTEYATDEVEKEVRDLIKKEYYNPKGEEKG